MPYTHGTPFRRAVEEGLLALGTSAHVALEDGTAEGATLSGEVTGIARQASETASITSEKLGAPPRRSGGK